MESLRSSREDGSARTRPRTSSGTESSLYAETIKNVCAPNTSRADLRNAVDETTIGTGEQGVSEQLNAVTNQLAQVHVRDGRSRHRLERSGSSGRLGENATKPDAAHPKTPERTTLERLRRKRIQVLERGASLRSSLTYTDTWTISAEHLQRQVRRFHEIVAESSYPDWMAEFERRARLARHLRKVASSRFRGCRVDVYGSTATGVLLKGGDLDVNFVAPMAPLEILRAEHQDDEYSLDDFRRDVVGDLGRLLRRRRHEFANVQIITQTRVPLVKFHDLRSDIEVDVQVNNDFVVRNTALLRAYIRIDPRVRPLAIFIKRWAVARDLNEPYAGTLSSYSYLILLIQYLQLVSPPVLPCLQALRVERLPLANANGTTPVEELVECPQTEAILDETQVNDYFLDRTDIQMPVRNEMSVMLLLAGFFYFYGYQFNYDEMVVSIRCGRLISKKKRGWYREDRASQDAAKPDDAADGIGELYAHASGDDTDDEVDDDERELEKNGPDTQTTDEAAESGGAAVHHNQGDREHPHHRPTSETHLPEDSSQGGNGDGARGQSVNVTSSPEGGTCVSHRDRERMRLQRQRFQRERAAHALQRHFFSIEDPFDMTHDLGRVCSEDSVRLLQHEFRRAFAILAQQLPLEALLQPYVHSEKSPDAKS